MFTWIKERLAFRSLMRDPVAAAAATASSHALASIPYKGVWSKNILDSYSQLLLELLGKILSSPDRIAACREQLSHVVFEATKWHSLMLTPKPEDDPMCFCEMQGVTGELQPHLVKVAAVDDVLKNFFYGAAEHDPTYQDVYQIVQTLYWRAHWFAQTIQVCRAPLKDFNEVDGRDWYKPFYHSMMVWNEAMWRQKLGLPSALGENSAIIELAYSTFSNLVTDGEKYPDRAWREFYKDMIQDGRIKVPDFS